MSLFWRRQLQRLARNDPYRDIITNCIVLSTYNSRISRQERDECSMPDVNRIEEDVSLDDDKRSPPKNSKRRIQWQNSLPTPQQAAEQLRANKNNASPPCPPSSTSNSTRDTIEINTPSPHWRDIVSMAYQQASLINNHTDKKQEFTDKVLTDTFGRAHNYLRISLTERCNLRCLYCMPEDGVDLTPQSNLLTVDEIERLVKIFAAEGITKVRLTGGEPTLRRDLEEIVSKIASIRGIRDVCMTTNGINLQKNLEKLKHAGLTHLNISLDTLKPDRFERMTLRRGHARVLSTIDRALELGFDPVKVNVVVMKGVNDDEMIDFVELTKEKPLNVRFIEYMPFDGNIWSHEKLVSYKDMMAKIQDNYHTHYIARNTLSTTKSDLDTTTTMDTKHTLQLERCDDPIGEVAKNYRLPHHKGTLSFITSMTSAFCGDCNRLRLMADGNLKVCLFGANEVSLRDAMREGASGDDMRALISAAVKRKKAAHAGMFELAKTKNRAMVKIGG